MGRGSHSVGRGCILGGQGLLCSEITKSANFASSKISCDLRTDVGGDTPSYRVAQSATKNNIVSNRVAHLICDCLVQKKAFGVEEMGCVHLPTLPAIIL